jgi:hypothetical protein
VAELGRQATAFKFLAVEAGAGLAEGFQQVLKAGRILGFQGGFQGLFQDLSETGMHGTLSGTSLIGVSSRQSEVEQGTKALDIQDRHRGPALLGHGLQRAATGAGGVAARQPG